MGWQLPDDWNVYGPWSTIGVGVEKQPTLVKAFMAGVVVAVGIREPLN